jgi:hypothetical protein
MELLDKQTPAGDDAQLPVGLSNRRLVAWRELRPSPGYQLFCDQEFKQDQLNLLVSLRKFNRVCLTLLWIQHGLQGRIQDDFRA